MISPVVADPPVYPSRPMVWYRVYLDEVRPPSTLALLLGVLGILVSQLLERALYHRRVEDLADVSRHEDVHRLHVFVARAQLVHEHVAIRTAAERSCCLRMVQIDGRHQTV